MKPSRRKRNYNIRIEKTMSHAKEGYYSIKKKIGYIIAATFALLIVAVTLATHFATVDPTEDLALLDINKCPNNGHSKPDQSFCKSYLCDNYKLFYQFRNSTCLAFSNESNQKEGTVLFIKQ
jgi:hypothetical protein